MNRLSIFRWDKPAAAFARFGKDIGAAFARLAGALGLWLAFLLFAPLGGQPLASYAANSNDFISWQQGAQMAVFMLANNLGFVGNVDRQIAQDTYRDAKFGSQIQVPRPPRFKTRTGPTAVTQGAVEPKVVVTVQPEIGVDMEASEAQLDLLLGRKFDEWKDRIAKPMMEALANEIDFQMALNMERAAYLIAGTAGTNPANLADLILPGTLMSELGTPMDDRIIALDAASHGAVMNGLSGNFVTRVIDSAEMKNRVDFPIAGFDQGIVLSQNVPTHTVGAFVSAATAVVNGPGQSGSTLITSGWPAGAILNLGDIISIAGVQSVNWQNRQATGRTATFNVTAQATADAGGNMTINIYPAIVPPVLGVTQQFQTVDSFPANGAAISVNSGTTGQVVKRNLAWHRKAAGFVSIPMSTTAAADMCTSTRYRDIEMRMWLGPDITNGRKILRMDVLPAFPVYAPEGIAIVGHTT